MNSRVINPVLTLQIKLPRGYHLRCVIWENVPALRANTPEYPTKDHVALFVPSEEGRCIGTINLAATDLSAGTRAHEIQHALEHYDYRLWNEARAKVCEAITNEIDLALKREGLT